MDLSGILAAYSPRLWKYELFATRCLVSKFTELLNTYVDRRLAKRLRVPDGKDPIKNKKTIASAAGLNESLFSQYLNGHKVPKQDTTGALARVLELDAEE